MHLPLLHARASETGLCTYCPKLCRPACPVSTVEGRETVTPWGKMRAQDELRRGAGALSAGGGPDAARSRAEVAYACTGCGDCQGMCLLDNPVADTLRDARADALANGLAPDAAVALVHGWDARMERLRARARDLPVGEGRTAFLPGCTTVTRETDAVGVIAAGVRVLTAGCALIADDCCGAPLLEAGDREGFVRHAGRLAARLGGFQGVVTSDAGCAYALRVQYPAMGLRVPPVEHIAETAQRHVGALHRVEDPRPVVYQDSCRLSNGLGVLRAPRDVLTALRGKAPEEAPWHGSPGGCSGGGGLLPVTRPATATAMAAERAVALREERPGAVVVTACAASRRMLSAHGVVAEDLAVWIARGVAVTDGTDPRDGPGGRG